MTEREKIVAYLLGQATEHRALVIEIGDRHEPHSVEAEGAADALSNAADAIENGLHLTWKPEPTIPASEWINTPSAE